MIPRKPEGYRDLLAYQKAQHLQSDTLALVALFPKTKTFVDLADQMSRSARSTTKNIVEGWKRNTTKEYIGFLGFSIGSNSEMMEDAADVATGVYKELTGVRGIMGERGTMSREHLDKIPFYPLDSRHAPIVKLFLEAKEVNFLLARLQKSLDRKMDAEGTKPMREKYRAALAQEEKENRDFEESLRQQGFVRLSDGRIVNSQSNP